MSLWTSIANVFYPTGDLVAQGQVLDAEEAPTLASYQPGGAEYQKIAGTLGTGTASADAAKVAGDYKHGETLQLIATGDQNYDNANKPPGSSWGAVLKDIFVLGVIAAVIWAFGSFGGIAWLKEKSGRVKWLPWAIVGAIVAIAYVIYRRSTKTAADAGAAFNASFTSPLKTLFG
jgi:hypothetical protein